MLEFYWAYVDFRDLMRLAEEMVYEVAADVLASDAVTWNEISLDISRPWKRFTMRQALVELAGCEASQLESLGGLLAEHERRGLAISEELASCLVATTRRSAATATC